MKLIGKILGFVVLAGCANGTGVKTENASRVSGVHLIKKTVIGGTGGWDYVYVDSDNRRLYIAHGDQVEVLNADTHEKVGVIGDTKGVHGIVTVTEMGKGFATCGGTSSTKIFDIKTLAVVGEVPCGKKPDALLYDMFSGRVFVFNNGSNNATVIDAAAGTVVGTLELGGAPEAAVNDDGGNIFVNIEDKSELVHFDAKTLMIKKRWKLTGGEGPSGLAFDAKNHRLFSACENEAMIISDSETGTVIGKQTIGKGVDGAVFDSSNGCAVSSNGEGTITIVQEVSPTEFKVLENVATVPSARTCTIDGKTHHIFLIGAEMGDAPAPTADTPNPRKPAKAGTFMVLEYGK